MCCARGRTYDCYYSHMVFKRMSPAKGNLEVRLACLLLALSFTTQVRVNLGSYTLGGTCGYLNDIFYLNRVQKFSSLRRGTCVQLSVP